MQLAHRYLAVFFVVVVIAGGVLFATFDAHRTDVLDSTEESLTDRATTTATYLDNQLREQRRVVSYAATNDAFTEHRTARQTTSVRSFVTATAFEGASVVDETGEIQALVTVDGESPELVGESLAHREYVQRALAGEQHVSEPFRAETGNHIVVISAPLRVRGEVVGTINGAYHLDETELFSAIAAEDDDTGLVVRAGEADLYDGTGGFGETITERAALDTVDWTVAVHQDRSAVDRTVNRLLLFQTALGIVLLGSFVAFGGWVYRSQIGRIGLLGERLEALQRREYDRGPPLGGSAEWRRIDDALERLATVLDRREQMLLVLNRILRHNLRNKLNVVHNRAELLEAELDDDHAADASNIRETTDDLLTLADRARRTETLLDPPVTEPLRTDVAAEVRNRVALLEEREPSLSVAVSAPEPVYAACGQEIGTAIEELLANVVDYAGPEPSATVIVAEAGEHVVIRIEDDGPGIPAEEAGVVSGDQDITQLRHTLGVGLWLVKWIVDRYGGTLRFPEQDDGGVVEIQLPRADDDGDAGQPE